MKYSRALFAFFICTASFACAEQVSVNAELTINIENDDFSQFNKRALITERKKIEWDILLEKIGQVPCALLSALSGAGVVAICIKVARKEWPKEALFALFPCGAGCPAFAAWYLDLENKKIFNQYLLEEINDQLALRESDKITCQEAA